MATVDTNLMTAEEFYDWAKRPENRYQTSIEVALALEAALLEETAIAPVLCTSSESPELFRSTW